MKRPDCPELKARAAALPTPKVMNKVKKWLKKISELRPEECPIMSEEEANEYNEKVRNINNNNNTPRNNDDSTDAAAQQQQKKQKKLKERKFEWREVAKFDTAITLEMLSELDQNYAHERSSDKDTDELRYGALARAISRWDERPGKCFSRDILLGILNCAANCYEILLPPKKSERARSAEDDADGLEEQDDYDENNDQKNNNNNNNNKQTKNGNNSNNTSPATSPQSKKPKGSPPINTMMIGPSHVLLTKLQCFCILSCSFLNIFPRMNNGCVDPSGQLPSINLGEMFEIADAKSVGPIVNVEKLLMFFEYFSVSAKRAFKDGDPKMVSDRFGVIFIRGITPKNIPAFGDVKFRDCPMGDLQVMELRKSIDDQKHTIRLDFANAVIGGASLSFGCVQEEIMFAECPEMNCARWMNPEMNENEAILILRGEQFATHAGYAHSLIYQGPHTDGEQDILNSAVIAVDAFDYRYGNPSAQYSPSSIQREFFKLCAAMDACEVARVVYGVQLPSTLCTGNWGCGVFRGDAELKAFVQWLSFSIYGLKTLYCPFDNPALQQQLKDISICCNAKKEKLNCAEVGEFLATLSKSMTRGASVCGIFAKKFKLDLEMAGESLYSLPRKLK